MASARSWFFKLLSTTVALLSICWVAPRYLEVPQFVPTSTDELQFVIVRRYLELPIREIVLVGSSLTFRLKEEFFARGNVRNLGIPGNSALTGLSLIEESPAPPPRLIAVEATIFDRNPNSELLAKAKHQQEFMMRPLRSLAAFYQSKLDRSQPTLDPKKTQAILRSGAQTNRNAKSIQETLISWSQSSYDAAIADNVQIAKKLISKLEARGSKVLFYELPVAPPLRDSHYVQSTRETLVRTLGLDNESWLRLNYPAQELRWDDAIHLDERSALIIALALQEAIDQQGAINH